MNVLMGFRRAAAFLTRIPNRVPFDTADDLASAVPWFPVVGGGIGMAIAGVYSGLFQLTSPIPAAAGALAFGAMLTGAFHEDGLGDMADGFGGGHTRSDVLRIMKDSRQGTYGVMAIALSLMIRVAAIATLPWRMAVVAIPAAHVVSRASAVALMRSLPAATEDGLGSAYLAALTTTHVVVGVSGAAVISGVLLGVWAAIGGATCAVVALWMRWLTRRKIGGITGDVLGATQQICECAMLLMAAGIVTHHWPIWGMMAL